MSDPSPTGPGCGRRGRPRMRRPGPLFQGRCFEPCDPTVGTSRIVISPDELQALRLVDLEDMTQEEAADEAGISRRTLWKDLHEARKKVADALVNGKTIEVEGKCPGEVSSACNRRRACGRFRCGLFDASAAGDDDALPQP
ncbi:MAG: DUF134 domain-containing protein [Methanomicrobiales archaeon]|nr:DUF134 domain-containing protein [Methanomicrobiales archaeon]